MYKSKNYIKLPDTDAAGILFFANYIKLAHDVYEAFMAEVGFSLKYIINDAEFFLLIAHTEADYKIPLKLGENYSVNLKVEKIGRTSFVLKYDFFNSNDELSAIIKTTHVTVDKNSNQPDHIFEKLKSKLEIYT